MVVGIPKSIQGIMPVASIRVALVKVIIGKISGAIGSFG